MLTLPSLLCHRYIGEGLQKNVGYVFGVQPLGQAVEGGNTVGYFFNFLAMSTRRGCLQ
jgi:hypothetical protein